MFGIILFWLQYIISGIVLYHILRCIYIKGNITSSSYSYIKKYSKTDNDKRLKHPIWIILIFIIVFLIPILNITILPIYLGYRTYCEYGEDRNPYYCKSVFTKKY